MNGSEHFSSNYQLYQRVPLAVPEVIDISDSRRKHRRKTYPYWTSFVSDRRSKRSYKRRYVTRYGFLKQREVGGKFLNG